MAFTSNAGRGHLVKLPLASRIAVSEAFVRSAEAYIRLVDTCLRQGGRPESRATSFIGDSANLTLADGREPIEEAVVQLLFTVRAGLDHLRLASIALRDERASFSLMTLTRSCVEILAKAHWLLSSEDSRQFALRSLSMRLQELGALVGLDPDNEVVDVSSGRAVGAADEHAAIKSAIKRVAVDGKAIPHSPAGLAVALGVSAKAVDSHTYALLSSVAHGESVGIGNFLGITTGTRTPQYVVGVPAWLAQLCLEIMFDSMSYVLGELELFMHGQLSSTERWADEHDAAKATMKEERARSYHVISRSRDPHLLKSERQLGSDSTKP